MRRKMSVRSLTVLSALVVALPSVGGAQQANDRGGFWLSGGLGAGYHDHSGTAAYLRMGGTLADRLVLGGESLGFVYDEGDTSVSRGNLTLSALFYPSAQASLFVKAGVGFATIEKERSGVTREGHPAVVTTMDEVSLGTTFGVGYDIRLGGGNLYLTPNLDALLQSTDGDTGDPEASLLLTVGIGFR